MSATLPFPLPELSPAALDSARCTVQWLASKAAWEVLKPEWRETHRRFSPENLGADPDWCEATEVIYPGITRVVCLRRGGPESQVREVKAVVPLHLRREALDCQIGECNVLRLWPRTLSLAGDTLDFGQAPADYATFFEAILGARRETGFDVLRLTAPTASWLWRHLQQMDWAGHGLNAYQPDPPVQHHLIRMPESFDAYIGKFTAKTRKNRFRELKLLGQRGEVTLDCYRQPERVETFLSEASAISRRSYQHKLLGAGLREPERIRPRLQLAARRGWLRSYVLRCGGAACSYMLGYQYGGRYHYVAVGFDPAWKLLSVGTVLQMLVLQELFERETPQVFDFGIAAPQKQYFGNDSFEESTLLLFRRGLYPGLVRELHQASRRATRAGTRLLESCHLKTPALHFLRRLRGC